MIHAPTYQRAALELELDSRRRELASLTGQPLADVEAACQIVGQPLRAHVDAAWAALMSSAPSR